VISSDPVFKSVAAQLKEEESHILENWGRSLPDKSGGKSFLLFYA